MGAARARRCRRPREGDDPLLDAPGILVAGTDTGVGKTVLTAAIALAARSQGRTVAPYKPAQTGDDPTTTSDPSFVARVLGLDEPPEALCPYRLREPLAPAVAAGLEGVRIDMGVVEAGYRALAARYALVVVESAGGVLVPLTDGVVMADLAARLHLPVVVAARPGLGTLNHTMLTLEALHRRGATVLGVVLCGVPDTMGLDVATNVRTLTRMTPVPILGAIPYDPSIGTGAGRPGRLADIAVGGLDPLLGGTFSPSTFRRRAEQRIAELTTTEA